MGVLESRVLDFDTVIVTSMNEGKFPAGKSQNSFIPYDVKRELGLPHSKRKTQFIPIIFIIYCNVLKTSICFITPKVKVWMQVKKSVTQLSRKQAKHT
jgi:inactivated superfamily I helicase